MGGGWLDGGSFHMIEFNQCLLERRAGGESGVEWVEACKGDAAIAGERDRLLTIFLAGAASASLTPSARWCVAALSSGSFEAGNPHHHCWESGLHSSKSTSNHRVYRRCRPCAVRGLPLPQPVARTGAA